LCCILAAVRDGQEIVVKPPAIGYNTPLAIKYKQAREDELEREEKDDEIGAAMIVKPE